MPKESEYEEVCVTCTCLLSEELSNSRLFRFDSGIATVVLWLLNDLSSSGFFVFQIAREDARDTSVDFNCIEKLWEGGDGWGKGELSISLWTSRFKKKPRKSYRTGGGETFLDRLRLPPGRFLGWVGGLEHWVHY